MKYIYSLIRFTKEIMKIVIFIISILFSGYFILGTIYSTLFIELRFKEQIISSMSNKELNFMLFGLLGILGILGFRKIAKPILSKGEIIIYLLSSYFLSYFIVKNFQFPSRLFIILIISIFAIIFFLLLQITDFFYSFNVLYLKELILKEKIKLGKNISQFIINFNNIFSILSKIIHRTIIEIIQGKRKNIISKELLIKEIYNFSRLVSSMAYPLIIFFSIIILIIGLSGLIILGVNQYLDFQNQLRRSFTITKILPKNTTQAENVSLKGYNFGWKLGDKDKLMSNDGQINDIKLWTNDEIRFAVPLHLKDGKNIIWLEKSESDSSNSAILKSNKVTLNIISRWEFYPSQINYENLFYPLQKENLIKRIKRFLFFKLKLGDIISLL
ncbi:membrane hypothetical protein [Candidatus Roizmanbacteria bacterium]|nr:membrane hypothetical protein [Candidatus Roizmanbacteria bacterium]